jgi:hypothetical protein
VRVISSTLGSLTNDPFKITVLAANTYIPLYAFHTYYQEEGVQFYQRPSFEKGAIRKPNTLKHIKDALEMAIAPRRITIGGKFYYFLKGAMYTEEGIPLMVLGMARQAYQDPDIRNFSDLRYGSEVNPVDNKNFVLFYSTSFFTDPNLAPLNRRFQKELLLSCYQKGIEVRVITSSEIEKNTFASIFEIPKANSVSQLEEYMNKVLPTFLHIEEEDSFVFEELEVPESIQDHELSVEEEALLFDTEEPVELLPIFDTNYHDDEYQAEREEMEREAATWSDFAHTESPYLVAMDTVSSEVTITERRPHPVDSLVERMRPLQNEYNRQMHTFNNLVITGESVVHADYAIVDALNSLQARRDNRPIELIDDTE